MPPDTVSKAANLARIRENQRRCRARRREYIAELEQKIRTYEQRGVEATIEVQTTARKLARENELLRGLLRSVGFDDNFQEYIRAGSQEPSVETTPETVSTAQQFHLPSSELAQQAVTTEPLASDAGNSHTFEAVSTHIPPCTGTHALSLSFPDSEFMTHLHNTAVPTDPDLAPPLNSDLDISPFPVLSEYFAPTPETSPYLFPSFSGNMAFDLPDDGSMLCSMAYKLIMQYNKKGYDDLQLNIKLCKGFKKGRTPLEGCRVENKVLFSVLTEIS